jgi:hypothetical protein
MKTSTDGGGYSRSAAGVMQTCRDSEEDIHKTAAGVMQTSYDNAQTVHKTVVSLTIWRCFYFGPVDGAVVFAVSSLITCKHVSA